MKELGTGCRGSSSLGYLLHLEDTTALALVELCFEVSEQDREEGAGEW